MDEGIVSETAKHLSQAVVKGFEKPMYTEPDVKMVHSLLNNTWEFAGFKTQAQAEAISLLLADEQGKPRSLADFKKEAQKVGVIYNQNWLNVEYQHAIAASQAASKWVDIQANKKALPLLQYDTAGDNRVRASHASLDGITLPIADPFWQSHYPPWEWACRCTVRQLASGSITPDGKVKQQQEIAGPSRFKNIGITGKAFPEDMPFFKAEDLVKNAVMKAVSTLSKESIKEAKIFIKQKVYDMPIEDQYTILDSFENGGHIKLHVLADKNMRDWDDVYGIAKVKAADGADVKILPIIDRSEQEARTKLMPGHIGNSNADLLVNGKLVEVEKTAKYSNLNDRITSGSKQAHRVVIIYNNDGNDFKIGKNTANIYNELKTLENIEFYNSEYKKIAELKPTKIKKGK